MKLNAHEFAMPWTQVYNPTGSAHPLDAARRGAGRGAARRAGPAGLVGAEGGRGRARDRARRGDRRLRHAVADGARGGRLRRVLRPVSDRLDRVRRRVLVRAHGRVGRVRNGQGFGRRALARPADPGPADRVQLRRVHRRGRRLRHAGRHLGRALDRHRLPAALRRRTRADRQHGARSPSARSARRSSRSPR